MKMNDMAKNLLLWLIIAVVLLTVFQSFNPRGAGPADMSFSDFMQHVQNKEVAEAVVRADNRTVEAKMSDGSTVKTQILPSEGTIDDLRKNVRNLRVEPADNGFSLISILVNWVPFLIFIPSTTTAGVISGNLVYAQG